MDSVRIARSRKLEVAALKLVRYFSKWKMLVNSGKTKVMLLEEKLETREIVRVGEARVKMRQCVRYLGVDIDKEMVDGRSCE